MISMGHNVFKRERWTSDVRPFDFNGFHPSNIESPPNIKTAKISTTISAIDTIKNVQ